MKNYQDMNNEEIKEQLEWSDQHEFSYGYSMWAFNEIERLNNIINEAIDYLKSDNYWLSQVKANNELLKILKGE